MSPKTLISPLRHLTVFVVFIAAACLIASLSGCPDATPTPDGGNPDTSTPTDSTTQPLVCEKGTLCLKVGNKDARACDILLKDGANIESPQVSFQDGVIGQVKHRDVRLALSFISNEDGGIGGSSAPVLIKLDAGVAKIELVSGTCYDRKGVKIAKPDIQLERP